MLWQGAHWQAATGRARRRRHPPACAAGSGPLGRRWARPMGERPSDSVSAGTWARPPEPPVARAIKLESAPGSAPCLARSSLFACARKLERSLPATGSIAALIQHTGTETCANYQSLSASDSCAITGRTVARAAPILPPDQVFTPLPLPALSTWRGGAVAYHEGRPLRMPSSVHWAHEPLRPSRVGKLEL